MGGASGQEQHVNNSLFVHLMEIKPLERMENADSSRLSRATSITASQSIEEAGALHRHCVAVSFRKAFELL